MKFNTKIRESFGNGDESIVYENYTFTIYKKSTATRIMFGMVGTALATGNEVARFNLFDIDSYAVWGKYTAGGARITLRDGKILEFDLNDSMKRDLLPVLEGVRRVEY